MEQTLIPTMSVFWYICIMDFQGIHVLLTHSFTYTHMHNDLQKQTDAPWITADASIICH